MRPSWDEYFMSLAEAAKTRSTCQSPKGALLVRGKQVITTGYNDTPVGVKNCGDGGCPRCADRRAGLVASGEKLDYCMCCHAEENTISQAARIGISTVDSTMYTTYFPCTACVKMLINAGVKKIVAKEKYPDDLGIRLLSEAGIELVRFKENR